MAAANVYDIAFEFLISATALYFRPGADAVMYKSEYKVCVDM